MKTLYLIALALLSQACHPVGSVRPAPSLALDDTAAFARMTCGGCHAVGRYGDSPNPGALPFASIVNQPGVTPNTLRAWLRDAHNYPDEMKVRLNDRQVSALTSYILTLRDPNYRPSI